jgi:hypothetical protein
MNLEKYPSKVNATETVFTFVSEGPKGKIIKRVQYKKVKLDGFRNVYNLAFGDKKRNSTKIDDLVVTNNQDREKVLTTVANTVLLFTKRRLKAHILILGSTPSRTRLYQIAINKYFDELAETFEIKGYFYGFWLPFDKNLNFAAFLIIRKTR